MRSESGRSKERLALGILLAATALLYLWGLGASGWANSYYSAAAQAGASSWKAFLFGSTDAANAITVDKTPMSLWPMALSVRIFGLSAWSVLVPQALEGVATVWLLYLAVRRWFGIRAGLLAGAVMALTPVAVLMFRFNNPDALLMLLSVASVYFVLRGLEDGRTRWLVAAGAMVGFGFLTKQLQAFVLVPVLVGTYWFAGPGRFVRRFVQTVWMGVATVVAGGWWVAVVSLWPASQRPYFGGSQNNTFFDVLFGYNGLGRLNGNEVGSVVRGGVSGRAGQWGSTGIGRMFNNEFGAQASWLMPAALLVLLAGLVWTMRRPRTDRTRSALLLWGGWLVVTGLVFSLSQGIIHEYYTVALAPPIGALVGIGACALWRMRDRADARAAIAACVAVTSVWSFVLLSRVPSWQPWLRWTVLVAGAVAVVAVLAGPQLESAASRASAAAVAALMLVALFAAPAAYALETAATPHTMSLPIAGPGGVHVRAGQSSIAAAAKRRAAERVVPGRAVRGGLLERAIPTPSLEAMLTRDGSGFEWVAATVGSNRASGYQLATGRPVMALGGFNGSDPTPTLEEFQRLVAERRVRFFIAGWRPGSGPAADVHSGANGPYANAPDEVGRRTMLSISHWVKDNFAEQVVDGIVLFDLTRPKS